MATVTALPPEENSNICEVCLSDNLLKAVGIRACPRCNKGFCVHYASKFDAQYCVDCMSEITVTENQITKITEHYNEITDKLVRYSQRAKQIKLDGQDWLFAQRRVKDLNEAELAATIEYHISYYRLLVLEAEERRVAHAHRNAGVRMSSPTSVTTSVTTTINKSTQAKSTKQQAQMSALIGAMIAKGMTMEQIMAMLKGGKP